MQKIFKNGESALIPVVFGPFDENAGVLEAELDVKLINRDDTLAVSGSENNVDMGLLVLENLFSLAARGEGIDVQKVRYLINLAREDANCNVVQALDACICITTRGKPIKPKTIAQKKYVECIEQHVVSFGIGPAGTGKTYLAVALAVAALKSKQVAKIVLTRPAVEAGEKLGFLPGDLQNKVDPYLRPLYDALFEMLGPETVAHYMEKNIIEIAPLAYMRGRTLDNSFIILDEAQNTSIEQMKMFLTRFGFNSKIVVTGDPTQIDLDGRPSGLMHALKILKEIDQIGIHRFEKRDIVRHALVQKIVDAYERTSNESNRNHGKPRV
ncbi:MAG: phosphate starvation-inducible protein PhoH [Clostridiales bacterium]|nr:MAG: phosphate starvation-inducible protein PhoH [Clostridiales bacterium]